MGALSARSFQERYFLFVLGIDTLVLLQVAAKKSDLTSRPKSIAPGSAELVTNVYRFLTSPIMPKEQPPPPQPPSTLVEKIARANAELEKWSKLAASPNLSPEAA